MQLYNIPSHIYIYIFSTPPNIKSHPLPSSPPPLLFFHSSNRFNFYIYLKRLLQQEWQYLQDSRGWIGLWCTISCVCLWLFHCHCPACPCWCFSRPRHGHDGTGTLRQGGWPQGALCLQHRPHPPALRASEDQCRDHLVYYCF